MKPLLQDRTPQRMGHPRVSDGAASTAIVFMLVTEIPWWLVPQQIRCSGVSAWRRLRGVAASGVWERLHCELLRRLNAAERIDWSWGRRLKAHPRSSREA